jgi:outer membrane immunogenic protein
VVKLLSFALAATIVGTPAIAADMALKARPAAEIAFSWTGYYVGAELGGSWSNSRWTTTSLVNTGTGLPITGIDASSPRTFNTASVRAGGYAGYNWQVAPQVIWGIEADVAYADGNARTAGIPGCTFLCTAPFVPALGPDQSSVRVGWDGSARVRLGFLVTPDALIYGTGGIAWQNIKTSATCAHSGPDPFCGFDGPGTIVSDSNSFTRVGWTAGIGIDWHVSGNWIARGEYRYSQFDNRGVLNLSVPVDTSTIAYQLRTSTNIATVGIAYKFGGPVVARY